MKKNNSSRSFRTVSRVGIALGAASCACLMCSTALAATLYVTPLAASVPDGSTFSVTVKTDTGGQPVNTVEANVSFDSSKLEILSVTPGSTFTLQTPGSPSHTDSTASFSEGIPSPGYNGSAGIVGRITFKAIAEGSATISVDSGQVLLNDGNATDALSGESGSTITVTVAPAATATPAQPATPAAAGENDQALALTVSSSTHLDQDTWYPSTEAIFSWDKPDTAAGYSYKLDTDPTTIPDDTIDTSATTKTFTDLQDGTWYFHIKALDKSGNAGPASTYKILVDTTAPEQFTATQSTDVPGTVNFQTSDAGSGIDHYTITEDGVTVSMAASSPYTFSGLTPGSYPITVTAYDKAGNSTSSQLSLVMIKPQSLFQKLSESAWFIYAFAISIWVFLLAIIILLIVLIRRHRQTTNKAAKEIDHLKKDVDKELEQLKRHIHIQLDTLAKKTTITVPETKTLRKKLLASIKKLDDMVAPAEEVAAKPAVDDVKKGT